MGKTEAELFEIQKKSKEEWERAQTALEEAKSACDSAYDKYDADNSKWHAVHIANNYPKKKPPN